MPRPPAKAQAITSALAARIVEGEMAAGAWLPSERELAREFGADRSTVRRALRMLAEQGLVQARRGAGVQVRPERPVRRAASDVTRQVGGWRGFHVSVRADGRRPFTRTEVRETDADAQVARRLAVPAGTRVLERARVQGVEGEPPVQTATTWVIMEIVARIPVLREIDTGPGGLYSRLEEAGHRITFEEAVTCRMPLVDEQRTLAIGAEQPVLTVWRRARDQDDRVVEVTHRVVVGDRHELVYRYGSGA
ncbi:GntR family transcriptional regulator [Actinomadura sp. NEAU-AAG7]|uniref:GntR family transcriptional regulator n=1 Tax=Actinomadura sp. NEAU-AAG7 TaxID=2839640 RepID=UPI001BE422DE|nr:GntR family transcriptional regulator [Actinomadura sp. NEAU-AAG7]MBT2207359.1 GntR family transcriptional regulator [Actinomadura sp. NEAU-AAG7]